MWDGGLDSQPSSLPTHTRPAPYLFPMGQTYRDQEEVSTGVLLTPGPLKGEVKGTGQPQVSSIENTAQLWISFLDFQVMAMQEISSLLGDTAMENKTTNSEKKKKVL